MAATCPSALLAYRRREPEATVLHEAVRAHLNTFLAARDVPGHVRRALRRYLGCGVLAKGFVRVRCPDCRAENLVAFSLGFPRFRGHRGYAAKGRVMASLS